MILDQQILISGMYETFKDRGDPDPQACKGKIRHLPVINGWQTKL